MDETADVVGNDDKDIENQETCKSGVWNETNVDIVGSEYYATNYLNKQTLVIIPSVEFDAFSNVFNTSNNMYN